MTRARYNCTQSARSNMISALTGTVGVQAASVLTDLALRNLGHRRPASTDDLIRMAEYLMELGDLVRAAARSQKIEAVTYRALHAAVD
ncbi:hypothetical protein Ait01nite_057170 [Actinoplanes italicus]|uniref:ANTAR domain-containing protein n=1 Tax=Actinoplanes italicus TaxID=113567 RepID=A0A2T0K5L5_9ACTN|nr:hypothetical protein [Actinoplanes italicus]PRX18268.1 hypothetical protein CLV67_113101 [Actinoplanes italicus]GIE32672.1 hypothetical protein Ait01nite_057170 [Actinoplanes italicus]